MQNLFGTVRVDAIHLGKELFMHTAATVLRSSAATAVGMAH